jgi:hypothetical protein
MSEQHHCCAVCQRRDCRLYRGYGTFLRDDEIFCKAHIPADQAGWYVPLCEDLDGSVWGYTSAPDDAIERFNALPD